MSVNQEFIEAMRQEFSVERVMGTGQPPYIPGANPRTGYTGDTPQNQPAGIVHGGEQVIEAPMVQAAGGPEQIRQQVEGMAKEANQMGPVGRIPGYQSGTGSGTVPSIGVEKPKEIQEAVKPMKSPEIGTVKPAGTQNTVNGKRVFDMRAGITPESQKAQAQSAGTAANRGLTVATRQGETQQQAQGTAMGQASQAAAARIPTAPPIQPVAPKPPEQTATEEGLAGVRDIAAGKSEAHRILQQQALERQAGQAAASDMSLSQNLAQRGVEGGAAAAAKANLRREQSVMATQENVALAQQKAASQERAQETLFNMGMTAEKFNEAKRQFGEQLDFSKEQFGLDKDKFDQFIKQQGIENEWREHQYNNLSESQKEAFRLQGESQADAAKRWSDTQRNNAIQTAISSGDFDAVEGLYKEMGINIDTTKIKDASQAQDLGNSIANIQDSVDRGILNQYTNPDGSVDYEKAANSPEFKKEIDRAKQALNMTDAEAKEWGRNTLETSAINNSPFKKALQSISPEEMNNFAALNNINVDDYSFAGVKGAQGLKNAMASLQMTRALGFDEGGDVDINDSSQWDRVIQGDNYKAPEPGAQKLTGDVKADAKIKLDKLSSIVSESLKGSNRLRGAAAKNKKIAEAVSNFTPEEWDEVLSDPNNMKVIRDAVPEIGADSNIWTLSSLDELGLKTDKATISNTYEPGFLGKTKKSSSEVKDKTAGSGNGSVVLYNGEPYRLTDTTTYVRYDKEGNYKSRQTVVKGKPLTGGDEVEIVKSDKSDKRGAV